MGGMEESKDGWNGKELGWVEWKRVRMGRMEESYDG